MLLETDARLRIPRNLGARLRPTVDHTEFVHKRIHPAHIRDRGRLERLLLAVDVGARHFALVVSGRAVWIPQPRLGGLLGILVVQLETWVRNVPNGQLRLVHRNVGVILPYKIDPGIFTQSVAAPALLRNSCIAVGPDRRFAVVELLA